MWDFYMKSNINDLILIILLILLILFIYMNNNLLNNVNELNDK